ncbi:hypothetical protein RJ55_02373 [Drechmeria coniospora]|nr:hypothetical protein RJ55_02373 [Drechmeria coniospora]
MCNYIYKELSCQHHYHLVQSWCSKYIETQRRCPPTVVSKQYWYEIRRRCATQPATGIHRLCYRRMLTLAASQGKRHLRYVMVAIAPGGALSIARLRLPTVPLLTRAEPCCSGLP